MNFFYCPKCGKESLEDRYVRSKDFVCRNTRGGRCTPPIIHYKCECGNYFAGCMMVSGHENDEAILDYCRKAIAEYNEGGRYYWEEESNRLIALYEKYRGGQA